MWGDFMARMHELARMQGVEDRYLTESDVIVPDGEAAWWREAYRLMDEADGDVEDLEADIYQHVHAA